MSTAPAEPASTTPATADLHATRRIALRRLALTSFFAFGALGIHFPFFTPALLAVGMSSTAVGLMWSARSATHMFSPSLFGVLADLHGKSRLLSAFALVSLAVLSTSLAFVDDEAIATLLFALTGLLGGASSSLLDGLVLTALGEEKRRFGSVRVFGSIGFGVTALTFSIVDDAVALPRATPFVVAAALSLTASGLVLSVPVAAHVRLAGLGRAVRLVLRRDLLVVGAVTLFLWASHGAYSAFLAPLAAAHAVTGSSVGVALAVAIVCEVIAMRASVVLLERFGAKTVMLIATGTAVFRWAFLASTTAPLAFVAAQGLHGVTFGLFYPAVVTLVGALVPDEARQTAQGSLVAGFFGLGGTVGTAIAGHTFGLSATTTWWSMCALASVAFLIALSARRAPVRIVATT